MAPVAVEPKYCLRRKDMLWRGRESEGDEEKIVMNAPILNAKVNASVESVGHLFKQLCIAEE